MFCSFWKKRISQEELLSTAAKVQADAWKTQADAGIDLIGLDGTLYDQVSTAETPTFTYFDDGVKWQLRVLGAERSDARQLSVMLLLLYSICGDNMFTTYTRPAQLAGTALWPCIVMIKWCMLSAAACLTACGLTTPSIFSESGAEDMHARGQRL